METAPGKNERRVLAVGVLFATVGILALLITLMQPGVRDEEQRRAQDIFSAPSDDEKAQVMADLGASASTSTEMPTEAERLDVLQSLGSQR